MESAARRLLILTLALVGAVTFEVLNRRRDVRAAAEPDVWWAAAVAALRIAAFGLGGSALAVLFGWVQLGELWLTATLTSAYFAVLLTATAHVVGGLLAVLPRTLIGTIFRSIGRHSQVYIRRSTLILRWIAVLYWIWISLALFGIQDEMSTTLTRWWRAELPGEFTLTLGQLLAAVLVLVATALISRFVRFALKEDVLSRLDMQIGQTSAILTVVHYVVLMIGIITAATALGLSATQLTVVAGALGVGIGFGLQNITNNFISGLILIFERPISVGERVQVGQLQGIVQRIGIRASVVRTYEGADVIVPNAELVAREVINWTLSDRKRRAEVQVGVEYGTDPERVITLLEAVARDNDEVLDLPRPVAVFAGFGDSSLNFRLLFWVQAQDYLQLSSDIAVAVNNALRDDGITIPFPQRDLNLSTVSAAARAALERPDETS